MQPTPAHHPFIAADVEKDGLQLIGAPFKISGGTLSVLDPADQIFKRVEDSAA